MQALESNKVSVIVPVYNAENSVTRTIESLTSQSHKDIEIILINDGSRDKSGLMCDQFAKNDARIRVIHQQNKGPSAARNAGTKAATGTFIQFLDADDTVERLMTEILMQQMTDDVDLIICGYQSISPNNTIIETHTPAIKGKWNIAQFMNHIGRLYKQIILPSLCNKLYRTRIIQDRNIYFDETVRMGEDLLFNMSYIEQCRHVHLLPDPLYYYVTGNDSSLSSIYHEDLFENQTMLHKHMNKTLTEKGYYKNDNKYYLDIIYTNSIVNSLHNIFHTKTNIRKKQRTNEIKKIINDDYLNNIMENTTDNRPQTRLIKRLIKQKSVIRLQTFLLLKQTIGKNAQPLYKWIKQKNMSK